MIQTPLHPDARLPVPVPYGINGRDCPSYSGYRIKSGHLQAVKEWNENGLYALSGCRDKFNFNIAGRLSAAGKASG